MDGSSSRPGPVAGLLLFILASFRRPVMTHTLLLAAFSAFLAFLARFVPVAGELVGLGGEFAALASTVLPMAKRPALTSLTRSLLLAALGEPELSISTLSKKLRIQATPAVMTWVSYS